MADSEDKANILNDYFPSICTMSSQEANGIHKQIKQSKMKMSAFLVSEPEVIDLLNKLDCLKASSPGVSPRMLKEASCSISSILSYVFNKSLAAGQFPSSWKTGYLTPLFKSGDHNDPTNYRPITLLPILSKVLERLIYKRLYAYLV
ncbi:unnamed protein product, partial [Didymodactylos carnosus]